MTKSIEEIQNEFELLEFAEDIWFETKSMDRVFEDDCFIHIQFGNLRFVFYNGQFEETCLTEEDIPKFKKQIETILGVGRMIGQMIEIREMLRKYKDELYHLTNSETHIQIQQIIKIIDDKIDRKIDSEIGKIEHDRRIFEQELQEKQKAY